MAASPDTCCAWLLPLQALDACRGVGALADFSWRRWWSWSRSSAGLFLFGDFTYRIRRLQSFAENLLNERRPDNPLPDATDELGALARSLSTMADQLRGMVQR